jgi:hypothetical protein
VGEALPPGFKQAPSGLIGLSYRIRRRGLPPRPSSHPTTPRELPGVVGWVVGTRARPSGPAPHVFFSGNQARITHPHAGSQELGGLRTPKSCDEPAGFAAAALPHPHVARRKAQQQRTAPAVAMGHSWALLWAGTVGCRGLLFKGGGGTFG